MRLTIILLFLASFHHILSSQAEEEYSQPLKLIEFSYLGAIPVSTFTEYIDAYRPGFSFSVMKQLRSNDQVFLGFGAQLWRIQQLTNTYIDRFTYDQVTSRTASNVASIHLQGRYYTKWYLPRFEPYFDFNFGGHYAYMQTIDEYQSPDLASNIEVMGNLGISYGVGAGAQVNIASNVAMGLSAHYFSGNRMKYNTAENFTIDIPILNFTEKSTLVNYITHKIGIIIGF